MEVIMADEIIKKDTYGDHIPYPPFKCLGTTVNFHYWEDSTGHIFSSIASDADVRPFAANGMRYFIENVKEFAKERQISGNNFNTYVRSGRKD
jgi:hypothetical protein